MINEGREGIILRCKECGRTFIFTKNEQEFYEKMGWDNLPKKCFDCRKKKSNYIPREKKKED